MRYLLASLVLGSLVQNAGAQSASQARDSLVSVYMVTISQELCKFEMTDDQADAVSKASDKLEEQLGLSDEDAQKIYDQVEADMEKQKASGLCDPRGAWIKVYKESLAKLAQ